MSADTEAAVTLGPELLIFQVAETKPELLRALADWPGQGPLAIHCSALADLDGAGLQLLVHLGQTLQARGGVLQLRHCPPAIEAQIHAAGLAHAFEFDATATA